MKNVEILINYISNDYSNSNSPYMYEMHSFILLKSTFKIFKFFFELPDYQRG